MTKRITVSPEMTDEFVAHYTKPGTPYTDEPSETVPPGWYVLGRNYHDEEALDVEIRIEHAVDKDGNDVEEYMAKLIADRLQDSGAAQMHAEYLDMQRVLVILLGKLGGEARISEEEFVNVDRSTWIETSREVTGELVVKVMRPA